MAVLGNIKRVDLSVTSYSHDDYGFKIDCNFCESRHDKWPSDGAAAVIKQTARRAVNSQQALINQSSRISSVPTAKIS